MKLISYSLFDHPSSEPFEKMAYIRGFYFNARMNNLIYPDWRTHLEVDKCIWMEFGFLFEWLKHNNNLSLSINDKNPQLCEGMIWRMNPIFNQDVSHVLCRDCDSVTTYREALSVQKWIESGVGVLALHDNPAHAGLMGGMIGVTTSKFKALTGYQDFNSMIAGVNLSQRGSDQNLLNQRILPNIKGDLSIVSTNKIPDIYFKGNLPQVNVRFWESNLTCRHIGSAGVVDLEVLRFFKRFDIENEKYTEIEKEFSKIFYWRQ